MNCIFFYVNSSKMPSLGVEKKIKHEITALNQNGIETELYIYNHNKIIHKILERLPLNKFYSKKIINDLEIKYDIRSISYFYIRKHAIDGSLIRILNKLKKVNPRLIIIMELPTYPYDLEIKGKSQYFILKKDRKYRKKLDKYVDYITTFTDDDKIFNIKTIKLDNGVDINIPKRISIYNENKEIRLIAVALVSFWHGYDRLIKSIYNYKRMNGEYKIKFTIVGNGPELSNLKNLVSKLDLQKNIYFTGYKDGKELDELFNHSDIAVGCLALYRKNLSKAKSLKLREYCIRGIPFISAGYDEVFNKRNFKYMMEFENDDTKIEFREIIEFYEQMSVIGFDVITNEMNEFAKKNLTWYSQMSKIRELEEIK